MTDDVVVMYLGHEVEKGPVDAIFHAPRHPYTRALLRSIPSVLAEPRSRLATIAGSIPHPYARPSGCPFHPRCPDCMRGRLREVVPRRGGDRRTPRRRVPSAIPRGVEAAAGMSSDACQEYPRRPRRCASSIPIHRGLLGRAGRPGARGRRCQLHHRSRRDAVAGRRKRLRQDHHLALHPARDHADRGRDPLPHRKRRRDRRGAACRARSCGRCGGRCR